MIGNTCGPHQMIRVRAPFSHSPFRSHQFQSSSEESIKEENGAGSGAESENGNGNNDVYEYEMKPKLKSERVMERGTYGTCSSQHSSSSSAFWLLLRINPFFPFSFPALHYFHENFLAEERMNWECGKGNGIEFPSSGWLGMVRWNL